MKKDIELRRAEMLESMADMKELWEEEKQYIELASKSCREYFECLVKCGFNESQALEIIKFHGVRPRDIDYSEGFDGDDFDG